MPPRPGGGAGLRRDLPLFLAGAAIAGLGNSAIIRGSLTLVIETASPADRAGAQATYFSAATSASRCPSWVRGSLQALSPGVKLLVFAAVVGLGVLAAAPFLVRSSAAVTAR